MQTSSFKDTLATLKDASHIQQLDLLDEQGAVIDSIENIPGKSGSVSVYYHVSAETGLLDKAAVAARDWAAVEARAAEFVAVTR